MRHDGQTLVKNRARAYDLCSATQFQERIMTEQATPVAHDSHDSEQDSRQFPYTITEKLQDTLRQALDSAESPRDLGVA